MKADTPARPRRRLHLPKSLRILGLLALISCAAYAAIAWLSGEFVDGKLLSQLSGEVVTPKPLSERPILAVLGLLAVAFACYLAAIWVAVRVRDDRRLLWLIVLSSVAFRAAMLGSWPIQEVDIYRYLWDGAATTSGVSPFRYSPKQVLLRSADETMPEDLHRLVEIRESSPEMATILSIVHYGELPTIYPPVSQAVFAACTQVTPSGATVYQRLVIMKGCFVLFDLATLAVLIGLLRFAGRHAGWSLVYGWCPLVIKEIANSGHLDAVAVFLTTLAVYAAVRGLFRGDAERPTSRVMLWTLLGAALLALAAGAKLYPAVLAPLFAVAWVRRFGWPRAVIPAGVFAAILAAVLWPMVPTSDLKPAVTNPLSGNEITADPQDPSRGLATFLARWEMNDLAFMLVLENVKPPGDTPAGARPWFSVVPESWRQRLLEGPAARLKLDYSATALLLTRLVMGGILLVLVAVLAWHPIGGGRISPAEWAGRSSDVDGWLRAAFLTLAWLWLLCPAQNPWYWIWALPLVVFARSRAWLALSGLALVYYLRFWFGYHFSAVPVLGTGYQGTWFFDYVVVWLEFGPWFAWLAIDGWRGRQPDLCTECVLSHRPAVDPGE